MPNFTNNVTTGKRYESAEEWRAEGKRLFGDAPEDWRFKCPRCGNVATGQEFKDAGTEPDAMAQECIGRYVNGKGCDWAAFGFFDICTAHIHFKGDKWIPVFEFAEQEGQQNG